MIPTLEDIKGAQRRLSGIISPSPLTYSGAFSRMFGADIFLKLENLQETGSFKVRGAYNRLLNLSDDEKKKGVIAASAGNHAQGVASASNRLGVRATIVMPEDVPLKKLLAVKDYGAEVILFGTRYNDAFDHAREISQQTGRTLIPGFDDPYIIAGQGTIGLEIANLLEGDVAVLAAIGGGGLISGIAAAVKELYPPARVIGVQTKACPSTIRSLGEGRHVTVDVGQTIADGIAVNRPGDLNFSMIQKYVDDVVGVEEEDIAGAVLNLLEKANIIAEGAGAAPLAALMEPHHTLKAERYILIVSGGNIEVSTIDRILHRGSIKMGRLMQIEVNILDAPGSLWHLLGIIAREKANILHISHDRLDPQNSIEMSRVTLNLEIRGHEHGRELIEKLTDAGYNVKQIR
ncbi:MAG: threonine ammonia-lyase [Deltaproteobacteria bacterium]|nr:threonine ammonia-lyase [Deltaproteobacteria bacterium]